MSYRSPTFEMAYGLLPCQQPPHAGFEERRGVDAAGNRIWWVWCRECGTNHQRPGHCPVGKARPAVLEHLEGQ